MEFLESTETSRAQSNLDLETLFESVDQLEELLTESNKFNLLEAVGLAHREIKHSQLLAFLLDPRQTHGFSSLFLRGFLEATNRSIQAYPDRVIEFENWNLETIEVRREWQRIDVLLLDGDRRFAIVIENKIWSGEHGSQLQEYLDVIRAETGIAHVIPIFLTPRGDPPSHPAFMRLSYSTVIEALDHIKVALPVGLPDGVDLLLEHYADMLRSYIVGTGDTEERIRSFYARHLRALDLVIDQVSRDKDEIAALLIRLIHSEKSHLRYIRGGKHVQFVPSSWDRAEAQVARWGPEHFITRFQFDVQRGSMVLGLLIGPSAIENREAIFQAIAGVSPFLSSPDRASKFVVIYRRTFLADEDFLLPMDQRRALVELRWREFMSFDLERLESPLSKVFDLSTH